MPDVMSLYLDDSGTRHPDRNPADTLPQHGHDWFGLGGVIVRDADRIDVEREHDDLCSRWSIQTPLHSSEIRGRCENFAWVGTMPDDDRNRFYRELTKLMTLPSLRAIACVIDRPGYNARYFPKYGKQRWLLCKTAFNIVVERAAKYARKHSCKLRVFVERSDKSTDTRLRGYYDELRSAGHPFDSAEASKYGPLAPTDMRATLYDFKTKSKSSRLMQLADLALWPMCIGGYDPENRSYAEMRSAGTLVDCHLSSEALPSEGIKYSCWELQQAAKKPKPG